MSAFRVAALPAFLIAFVLAASDEHRPIGSVGNIVGNWCRNGHLLRTKAQLFLDDDVRYCSNPVTRTDTIVVDLDGSPGSPPHSRTYNCSTEGVCNGRTSLWLRGAYLNRGSSGATGTLLLSRPNVRGVGGVRTPQIIPDLIIKPEGRGVRLPAAVLDAVSDSPIKVCAILNNEPTGCNSYKPSAASPTIPLTAGLYGIYGDTAAPRALLLVTPRADLVDLWSQVPEVFRNDAAVDSVNERRSYLLNLYAGSTR